VIQRLDTKEVTYFIVAISNSEKEQWVGQIGKVVGLHRQGDGHPQQVNGNLIHRGIFLIHSKQRLKGKCWSCHFIELGRGLVVFCG
jgi:hypothetical protein